MVHVEERRAFRGRGAAVVFRGPREDQRGRGRKCPGDRGEPRLGRALALVLADRGFDTVAAVRDPAGVASLPGASRAGSGWPAST